MIVLWGLGLQGCKLRLQKDRYNKRIKLLSASILNTGELDIPYAARPERASMTSCAISLSFLVNDLKQLKNIGTAP